jgi:hypothetical protein
MDGFYEGLWSTLVQWSPTMVHREGKRLRSGMRRRGHVVCRCVCVVGLHLRLPLSPEIAQGEVERLQHGIVRWWGFFSNDRPDERLYVASIL